MAFFTFCKASAPLVEDPSEHTRGQSYHENPSSILPRDFGLPRMPTLLHGSRGGNTLAVQGGRKLWSRVEGSQKVVASQDTPCPKPEFTSVY